MNENITDINNIIEILKREGLEFEDSIELRKYIEENIKTSKVTEADVKVNN